MSLWQKWLHLFLMGRCLPLSSFFYSFSILQQKSLVLTHESTVEQFSIINRKHYFERFQVESFRYKISYTELESTHLHACFYYPCLLIVCNAKKSKMTVLVVWYIIWHDTIRYDTIRYDTIRYDTIRYDVSTYRNGITSRQWLVVQWLPQVKWVYSRNPVVTNT